MKPSHVMAVLGIAGILASCNANDVAQESDAGLTLQADQARLPADSSPNITEPMEADEVPEQVRKLVDPGDTLLAYKKIDMTNSTMPGAVIIVRHPVPAETFNYSRNPCELLVLRPDSGSYTVVGRSAKVVDCTNINFSREMAKHPNDLNEYLEVTDGSITYTNQHTKSTSIYSFEYSTENNAWFLKNATNNYPVENRSSEYIENVTETVRHPQDIGFITMQDFDPADLSDAFEKNRSID